MSGQQQLVALMCILLTALAITFLIMGPSIIQANKQRKD